MVDREELFDWDEPADPEDDKLVTDAYPPQGTGSLGNAFVPTITTSGGITNAKPMGDNPWTPVELDLTAPIGKFNIDLSVSQAIPSGSVFLGNPHTVTYSGFGSNVSWNFPNVAIPSIKRAVMRCEMSDGKVVEFECTAPSQVSVETHSVPPIDVSSVLAGHHIAPSHFSSEVTFHVKGGTPYKVTTIQP